MREIPQNSSFDKIRKINYCHISIKPLKQTSKVSNELYRSRETGIKVFNASKLSIKVRYIFGTPGKLTNKEVYTVKNKAVVHKTI